MARFIYEGPVMEFGKLLTDRWKGETITPTESKARSNLIYQFKRQNNRIVGSRITLPGKIKLVN